MDAVVLAVILGCAVVSWKKGVLHAAFDFLPMLTALFSMNFFSPSVGKFLRGTFLFDSLSGFIGEALGLDAAIQEGAMQTQTECIQSMPLPDFLRKSLLENNNPVVYQLLHADSLKEYIAGFLANVCLNILSVVLVFFLIYSLATIALRKLDLFSKLPVLHFFNHFMGFLIGGAKGVFFVWLGCIALIFFQCCAALEGVFTAMDTTHIAGFLYENNVLQGLVLTIFT